MVFNFLVLVSIVEVLSKENRPGTVILREEPKTDCRLIKTCVLYTILFLFSCVILGIMPRNVSEYDLQHTVLLLNRVILDLRWWEFWAWCKVVLVVKSCGAIDSMGDMIRGSVDIGRRALCAPWRPSRALYMYGQDEPFHFCFPSEDADDSAFWQAHDCPNVIKKAYALPYPLLYIASCH